MISVDDSEKIELLVNIEESAFVRLVVKGKARLGKPEKSNLDRLVHEGASFNVPNMGKNGEPKISGERNNLPLRVPKRDKGSPREYNFISRE